MAPTQGGASSPMDFMFEYKGLKFYHAPAGHQFTYPGIHVWVPNLQQHVQCLVETDDHEFLPVGIPPNLEIEAQLKEAEAKAKDLGQ